MAQLAAASGPSLSTVRAIEDGAEARKAGSRIKTLAALRAAGIRFVATDDGRVAVSKA
ncbi:hypothetical protein [Methylobacterium indicum]|uniref:Uncharacterized protein n=1 Tax=Methylobacterium indicum TaxID=1775910 RepID=A0A8H8WZH4_9HYPH|nr:hypothetical protein [Methylobacterium indicum]BCM86787.1 hypothetical protein mvi_52480 [Methylobacterium indicum]